MPNDTIPSSFFESINKVGALSDNSSNILIGLLVISAVLFVYFIIFPSFKAVGEWIKTRFSRENPFDTTPIETQDAVILRDIGELKKMISDMREYVATQTSIQIDKTDSLVKVGNESINIANRSVTEMYKLKQEVTELSYDIELIAKQYSNIVSITDAIYYATNATDKLKDELCLLLLAIPTDITNKQLWVYTQTQTAFTKFNTFVSNIKFEGCPEGLPRISEWSQHHHDCFLSIFTDYVLAEKNSKKLSLNDITIMMSSLIMTMDIDIEAKMRECKQ